MDKIDFLIKVLQDAKEELSKNVNHSYAGGTPNMSKEEMEKDAKNPLFAPKQAKVKELQAKIDNKTYKPDAAKIADKMLKDEAMMMGEGCSMKDMKMSKDGQWSLQKKHVGFKALEGKLEHEGHSKESAGNIAYAIGAKKYGKAGMAEKAHKSDMSKVESPSKREGDDNADQNHEEPNLKNPEEGDSKRSQPKIKETKKLER